MKIQSQLKDFYKSKNSKELARSLISDIKVSILARSGSGLLTSILKGLIVHILIKSKYPLFVGKRTRIVNSSNITLGKNVQIKNDVEIIAQGKIKIGDNVVVGEKTTLWSVEGELTIGNGVTIGRSSYIAQLGGPIKIGNNVLIGDFTKIHTLNHKYTNIKIPIRHQGYEKTNIEIKDNAWIGSGTMIINNTTIGKNSVVGAHSLVIKDVSNYSVFGGVPAKLIKKIKY